MKKSIIEISIGLTQIVLLIILVFQINGLSGNLAGVNAPAKAPTQPAAAAQPNAPAQPSAPVDMKALIKDEPTKGDAKAPVTIIEWSDFECPFCERFFSQTYGQLNDQYIKTGKAKLVFRNFPLSFHPMAQKAAEAAECAFDQGKFWEMHDWIYTGSNVQSGVAGLKAQAATLGLDTTKFNSCLDSGEKAAETQSDLAAGTAAGIRGTPGFLINGQLISGAQPFSVFSQAIDAAMKG
jgi:protein-disulfide isomerase